MQQDYLQYEPLSLRFVHLILTALMFYKLVKRAQFEYCKSIWVCHPERSETLPNVGADL